MLVVNMVGGECWWGGLGQGGHEVVAGIENVKGSSPDTESGGVPYTHCGVRQTCAQWVGVAHLMPNA